MDSRFPISSNYNVALQGDYHLIQSSKISSSSCYKASVLGLLAGGGLATPVIEGGSLFYINYVFSGTREHGRQKRIQQIMQEVKMLGFEEAQQKLLAICPTFSKGMVQKGDRYRILKALGCAIESGGQVWSLEEGEVGGGVMIF